MKIISSLKQFLSTESLYYVMICVLMFLSGPLNAYITTSILPEVIVVLIILYGIVRFNRICIRKNDLGCCLIILFFFLYTLLLNHTGDFFKEQYRFCFLFFFCLFLCSSGMNSWKLMEICLFLCKIHILFGIYEIVYINLFNPGGYESTFLVGKAMSQHPEDSQYLNASWEYGFPYIRPFGVLLQPQKSGFIYVVGIIMQYLIDSSKKKRMSKKWFFLFFAMAVATSAKTAILCIIGLGAIIFLNFYPRPTNLFVSSIFYCVCIIVFAYIFIIPFNSDFAVFGDVKKDIASLFNYGIDGSLMGIGILDSKDLMAHGWSTECSLARIIAQSGYVGFSFILFAGCNFFNTRDRKLNWILLFTILFMHIHYCVTNAHFIILCISVIVFYAKQNNILATVRKTESAL